MTLISIKGFLLIFAIVGKAEGGIKKKKKKVNPFREGCLFRNLGGERSKRVCNSDDPDHAVERGLCDDPPFKYNEVRIQNQDWHSPMTSSWIMQILLSELLRVPTTIETSSPDRHYNFYDPESRLDVSTEPYHFRALYAANDVGDCRKVRLENQETGEYKSCAHVFPMVNRIGQAEAIQRMNEDGIIAPPRGTGIFEQYRWWVPKIFALQTPSWLTHYGLAGETARTKLAELLKRPTDWGTYCKYVSTTNCKVKDEIAARAPQGDESKMYFSPGLYTGHFRATEKNNCAANPKTCTGHITNVPCTSSNYAVSQAYHLGIHVESDGNEPPYGRYNYSSIQEIYAAANATGSNVLLNWWEPDPFIERYRGTDFEMVPIHLPPPTAKCVENRVTEKERCSANFTEQVGSPEGSCGTGPVSNVMLMTLDECGPLEDASCSPAYSTLQRYEITNLDLQQIYQYGTEDPKIDDREAVCKWFVENLDSIEQKFVPRTYPRQLRNEAFYDPLIYFTLTVAALSMACVAFCAILSKFYQKAKVMVYAQVDFLLIILAGLFLVATGSLMYSLAPSMAVCICRSWFVMVGFSLELWPLAVKVAAINRIFHQSRRMRRVRVQKRHLYQVVGGCITVLCIYLLTWSLVDPPAPRTTMILTNESEDGSYVVEASSICASSTTSWLIACFVYLLILLIMAAAITRQNRDIKEEFNESRQMTLMIYSHLVFTLLRLAMLMTSSILPRPSKSQAVISLLLGLDVLITICIYFLPKLISARGEDPSANTVSAQRGTHGHTGDEIETQGRGGAGGGQAFAWDVTRRRANTASTDTRSTVSLTGTASSITPSADTAPAPALADAVPANTARKKIGNPGATALNVPESEADVATEVEKGLAKGADDARSTPSNQDFNEFHDARSVFTVSNQDLNEFHDARSVSTVSNQD